MSGGFSIPISASLPVPRPMGRVAGIDLATLDTQVANKRSMIRFVNRPLQAVEAQVDTKRGTARFARPVGHLLAANLVARSQGMLRQGKVRLTFAYEDGPAQRETLGALGAGQNLPAAARGPAESRYHYSYLAVRDAQGRVVHLNPSLVDPPAAATLFPLVVEDDSFCMFVTLDGRTNKPDLDARAKEIAEKHLLGPEEVSGEEGEANGFFDIHPSSTISRVRWEAGSGVTKTFWSIENVAAAKATAVARVGTTVVNRRKV